MVDVDARAPDVGDPGQRGLGDEHVVAHDWRAVARLLAARRAEQTRSLTSDAEGLAFEVRRVVNREPVLVRADRKVGRVQSGRNVQHRNIWLVAAVGLHVQLWQLVESQRDV